MIRIITFGWFLFSALSWASPFDFVRLEHVKAEHGLPSNTVFSVAQDETGFIWLGTPSGIGVFDGTTVKNYKGMSRQTKQFPLINPGNLFIDSQNRVWCGSWGQGLVKIESDRRQFTHFDPSEESGSLQSDKVQTFIETTDGTIWVGTAAKGLARFNEASNSFTHFSHDENDAKSLSHNRIWTVVEDTQGNMWLGTTRGLNYFDVKKQVFTRYLLSDDLNVSDQQIRALALHKNELWVGTRNHFGMFDEKTNSVQPYTPKGFEKLIVNKIINDGNNGLWLASSYGLLHFDTVTRTFSKTTSGEPSLLPEEDMRGLHLDRDGLLWMGTRESGLIKANFEAPMIAQHIQSGVKDKRQNVIWNLQLDQDNILWVGTGKGMTLFHVPSKTFHPAPDIINNNITERVYNTVLQSNGDLWIGTLTNLFLYQRSTGDLLEFGSKLNPNGITEISELYVDSKQQLWASASEQGLFLLDNDGDVTNFKYRADKPSISGNQVQSVKEDANGNIWAGTLGNGVSVKYKDKGHFEPFDYEFETKQHYQDKAIQDLAFSIDGTLWLATYNGLVKVDTQSAKANVLTIDDGFPSNEFKAITIDKNILWAATSIGITKYDLNSLELTNYGKHDGADNIFSQKAIHTGHDGNIYFGGDNGFNIADPSREPKHQVANVVVKEVWINNSKHPAVVFGKEALSFDLSYEQRNFVFKFTSLDYTEFGFKPLQYTLEGFDQQWHISDAGQSATYTNLDPGTYLFKVKDSHLGELSQSQATVEVKITPPIWANRGVKAFMFVFVVLVTYLFYLWRVRRLRYAKEILERRVKERTRELALRNSDLMLAYKKLEEISLTDQLTGLRNRRFLSQFLHEDIEHVHRRYEEFSKNPNVDMQESDLIFILMDLDNFKSVNDTYGHDAGDKVLTLIPEVMKPVFRDSDFFIRWGGEEFLVIARYTQRQHAAELAERLRRAVESFDFTLDNGEVIHRSTSIGYAVYPLDKTNPQRFSWNDVVKFADHALYAAKHSGRNNWVGISLSDENKLQNKDADTILKDVPSHIAQGCITIEAGNDKSLQWEQDL